MAKILSSKYVSKGLMHKSLAAQKYLRFQYKIYSVCMQQGHLTVVCKTSDNQRDNQYIYIYMYPAVLHTNTWREYLYAIVSTNQFQSITTVTEISVTFDTCTVVNHHSWPLKVNQHVA